MVTTFLQHELKAFWRSKNTGKSIQLGIFVTLGITLLIFSIYFVGQKQRLFSHTFRLYGVFNDLKGLQAGSNVRFSGINIGTIESVTIIGDSSVKVYLSIDESVKKFIKKDARVSIGTDGLMGNTILSISPGSPGSKEVLNGDGLGTIPPISMDDIFLKMKITADNAANITTDLADSRDKIHSGNGTIGKLFMDSAFARNVDQTLVNMKQGAGGFKQNMEAAKHSFLLRGIFKKKKKDKGKD